ncbi:MAG: replicative DNA helicase [Deltaproteobacteria bacterium]|nr:replicative DNA helicase [Deltaproteobacteria bacterium]
MDELRLVTNRQGAREAGAPLQAPANPEAEEAVLGAVLLDNAALDQIDFLEPGDFYSTFNRQIFEAMRQLERDKSPIDLVSLATRLEALGVLQQVGGRLHLQSMAERAVTIVDIRYHASLIRDNSIKRTVAQVSGEIRERAYQPDSDAGQLLDEAEENILHIRQQRTKENVPHVGGLFKGLFEEITARWDRNEESGVATGFSDLDEILSNLQPGAFVVVAGRPGSGKTSFVMNAVAHAASRGLDPERPDYQQIKPHPVVVFSLEMSSNELMLRMLSSSTGMSTKNLTRRGGLHETEYRRLVSSADVISQSPVWVDDNGRVSTLDIRARARRIKREVEKSGRYHKIGMVVIDYLQLMDGPPGTSRNASRNDIVGQISRDLKMLAKELQWPVVALSQLNRKSTERNDQKPQLSDLRESGAIEQDADVVLLIHRPEMFVPYEVAKEKKWLGLAKIIVAKNRHGPTDDVNLTYLKEITKFTNRAKGDFPDDSVPAEE